MNDHIIFLQYHQSGKISIELLDTESEGNNSDQDEESTRKFSAYVERFIQPGIEISDDCRRHLAKKPVFLPRSVRSAKLKKSRDEAKAQRNHVNNTNSDGDTANGDPSKDSNE